MDWYNIIIGLLGMIVLGFAIYGFEFWHEKSVKGYWIDIRDYEDLDDFWDYCENEFLRSHHELRRNERL